ncbi:ABC transporter substrate-binding protein [Actinoallomurus sp. NBC_01490]|uniref:ABC transporter substrate-binding protein n=1 Tax=Actinoallomurus sp. NBC_01490 TaxID=2903557 RepID=UPI002E2EE35B|nr:ABC transporter substrate-binding protein [Actinoallomurus sp. NBC_01490]
MKRTSHMAAALAAAVTLAFGAGCTNASETNSTAKAKPSFSAQAADKTLSAMVPAKIRTAGTIRVATDATYPPFESVAKDNKTIEGADIDLINEIASLLGLRAGLQNASFDAIVPGIAAGKFDVAVSGILDRPSRREHIDFVDYAMNSTMFFVKAENKGKFPTWANTCGYSIAVQTGTSMADDAQAVTKKCTAAGKRAIKINNFRTQDEVVLAVQSGRADVGVSTGGSTAAIVKQTGPLFVTSAPPDAPTKPGALGIAVQKSDPELVKAVQAALKKLIENGTYDRIMDTWGLKDCCSNKSAKINGGT